MCSHAFLAIYFWDFKHIKSLYFPGFFSQSILVKSPRLWMSLNKYLFQGERRALIFKLSMKIFTRSSNQKEKRPFYLVVLSHFGLNWCVAVRG